jgi:hypothetical protein
MITDAYYAQKFVDGKGVPNERTAITAWCRALYNLVPTVNSIISEHASIPMNYFSIEYPEDSKSKEIFMRQIDELQLTSIMSQMLLEYWILGEVYTYSELNERNGIFDRIIIQNPDYIIVKRSVLSLNEAEIYLRPDENIRRIALSDKKEDVDIKKQLSTNIIDTINRGENIKLNNFYVGSIIRKTSPYEIRGTSYLVPLISSFIENSNPDKDLIATCLMDPKVSSLAAERAFSAYRYVLLALKQWVNHKVFAPIAKINDLYQRRDDAKTLIMPNVKFDMEAIRKALGA